MNKAQALADKLQARWGEILLDCRIVWNEVTIEVAPGQIVAVAQALRDEPDFAFAQLTDLCGVDYLTYGQTQWQTQASETGFSRAVENGVNISIDDTEAAMQRFAVVYHVLSIRHNQRLRVKVRLPAAQPIIPTVTDIWAVANWYEREAFDLFGILFEGHPDLRRILTDYGFIGHPLRKDFPLEGEVEVRYDAQQRRVIYEPVSIEPRVLVPRVIRQDQRYTAGGR